MPTPTETITTTPPQRKRVQLDHALIDVDFLHKPKIIALVSRFRHEAVTFMLEVICQTSRATNGEINIDTIAGFSKMFQIEKWEEILSYCLEQKILTEILPKTFINERVIRDQEKLALKRDKERQRQKRHRDKTVTPDTDPVTDTEDLKKGEPEGDTVVFRKLIFDPMEWAGLVMNHFYGDEAKARDVCEAASDYLAQEGKPMPRDCLAYMRGWIRKSKEFARGGTGPKKKLTTEELNPEIFEEIFK